MPAMVRGSCLCDAIAWQAEGPLELMSHCHCSMCRKSHGTAFATYLAGKSDGFAWLRGREHVRRYQSSPGFDRPFCPTCGSVVAGGVDNGYVFMPAGCLDDDPGARPTAHVFVASNPPWHAITGELPRFDVCPPGWPSTEILRDDPPEALPGCFGGSCLCNAVAYSVRARPDAIINCHCSRCRKARSAAHASNLFVPPEAFRWTRGEEFVERYRVPDAARFTHCFCRTCGSSLPRRTDDDVMIPAGSLDHDPGARERMHIHVDSMAPWYAITDALPQHPQGPGSGDVTV
ncbi:MAG: GFA family protein [Deltaproteobacteria bacterium]|nr:GFA family protein [Deltaproteobacteria bacterium]